MLQEHVVDVYLSLAMRSVKEIALHELNVPGHFDTYLRNECGGVRPGNNLVFTKKSLGMKQLWIIL